MNRYHFHFRRIRHHLGKPVRVGTHDFEIKGYYANQMPLEAASHEPHFMAPLTRAMAENSGAFWDVGVNLGQTLLKVLSIDPARN